MGTKKGMKRKTARRAYEPKKKMTYKQQIDFVDKLLNKTIFKQK